MPYEQFWTSNSFSLEEIPKSYRFERNASDIYEYLSFFLILSELLKPLFWFKGSFRCRIIIIYSQLPMKYPSDEVELINLPTLPTLQDVRNKKSDLPDVISIN